MAAEQPIAKHYEMQLPIRNYVRSFNWLSQSKLLTQFKDGSRMTNSKTLRDASANKKQCKKLLLAEPITASYTIPRWLPTHVMYLP